MNENNFKLENKSGKDYLSLLSKALLSNDIDSLRVVLNSLQDAIDDKKMCSYMSDNDLKELIENEEGEATMYVGSGSAGDRIYIDKRRRKMYMPVSDMDKKDGIGKKRQDKFRKIFNIPENQELSVSF
jgi:hypothetical protein